MAGRVRLGAQALAVVLVASLFALLAWQLVRNEEEAKLAGPAPPFTLSHLDGSGSLSLASLRGKAVVLNFWASWCDPCEEEADELEAAWRDNRSRGLVVVGIDSEDFDEDARRFVRRHGITYPIVRAKPGETVKDYRVRGYPVTFVIDRRGILVGEAIIGPVDATDAVTARFEQAIELALAS